MNKQLPKHSLASKASKNSSKLKCILGQPFPRYCPKFTENDIQTFNKLIIEDMTTRKLDRSTYLKQTGIRIGLKSCLRVINSNGSYCCVLLSADIKPKFVAQQIIHMIAASNNKNTMAFCVPSLGEITTELFGIHSLAITLPNEMSQCIKEWIRKRILASPVPLRLQEYHRVVERNSSIDKRQKVCFTDQEEKIDFDKIYLPITDSKRTFVPQIVNKSVEITFDKQQSNQKSDLTGDYVSFSTDYQIEDMDISEPSSIAVLSKVATNNLPNKHSISGKYLGMKVHKIRSNPDKRKQKKK